MLSRVWAAQVKLRKAGARADEEELNKARKELGDKVSKDYPQL